MPLPPVVDHETWLARRKALLAEEKRFTRMRDELNARRRRIGMVPVEKDYVFEGPRGRASLLDLFEGRSQLVIQHFMFDPSWEDGCSSCSWAADEVSDGRLTHLHQADTTFAAVSRAPLERIEAYKARKAWRFPWYSSYGSDFNYDFGVTVDARRAPAVYNYRSKEEYEARAGEPVDLEGEQPGLSCFARDGDAVFHSYSTYARGTETIGGAHYILDLTALGRGHDFEAELDG